jgi:hypothetical protein
MQTSKNSMKECFIRDFEIKEINGELYVTGLIATSHIDAVGDIIPKETLETWAKTINNSDPQANKASYHHKREPKVVGRGKEGTAKVIQLPDKEWGLSVETHINKTWDGIEDLTYELENHFVDGFSIEYYTNNGLTTRNQIVQGKEVRILLPETELQGWGFASRPIQKEAKIASYGFKEIIIKTEDEIMELKTEILQTEIPVEQKEEPCGKKKPKYEIDEKEMEEFNSYKKNKVELEEKEKIKNIAKEVIIQEANKMEVKEQVLKTEVKETKELPLEVKEYKEIFTRKDIDVKEQFLRAGKFCDNVGLDWRTATTTKAESREYKHFGTNGRKLEYKGLGITTNQNTDTDYLQSGAELSDVYDPIIYNALNESTVTWNILAKDDFSGKGNNQVQFALKIGANTTAAFYTGNSVSTGNTTRLKYQTKFKKLQVGVSVDGDMIASARGGPVGDVFAQEVMDATSTMLSVLNAALFAEVGAETAAAIIGFEYLTDSAGNATLYSLTRSSTNKLSPDSATDTYINQSSAVISMTNLRTGVKQAVNEGANKKNLVWITSPTQGVIFRGKFDDGRRYNQPTDTGFGFETDIRVDGIPIFEDKDCNTDDWWLVDLETHRVAIWVPPTIEKLGKTGDSEDAYIKMYLATYNRAPRRMVQIYGCATS